jgi:hypothetical protein
MPQDQSNEHGTVRLREPPVAASYAGKEARKRFLNCLNSFFDEDATGNAYAIMRRENLQLEMLPMTGCALDGAAHDVETDQVSRLEVYEMIVVDSGNKHGDSWKAIFHPRQSILHFVREATP